MLANFDPLHKSTDNENLDLDNFGVSPAVDESKRLQITPSEWRSDYVVVEDVLKPRGNVQTRASFVVEGGVPGAKTA